MIKQRLAAACSLAGLVVGCSELDESKLKPRALNWDEQLLVAVISPSVPAEPQYVNGDKSRPYIETVCVGIGRDDPALPLLRKLGAGKVPVVGQSQCVERPEDDRYFDARSKRTASQVRVERMQCIDDNRCQVWVSGRYGGAKSWWKRGMGGWHEVPETQEMTWIS